MTEERQEVTAEEMETIKAILGLDAATFRRTKLGQYIFDRCEMQEENLVEELIEIALVSTDLNVVRRALDIQMHRMLPKFIDEAVAAGHGAEENIRQQEAAESPD
jgi:methenyltetrahydromethanopterin cyclohydrolase